MFVVAWLPLIGPPGRLRASWRCALACTARAASWDDLALSLSLFKSSELGRSGAPWPHLELLLPGSYLPDKSQNYTLWELLELYGCCQDTRITSYGLWPGWKFTDAWSQSSHDPTNSSTRCGPLRSSGLQWAAPSISFQVGCLAEPLNSYVWSYRHWWSLGWLQGCLTPWGSTSKKKSLEVRSSLDSRGIFHRCLYLCILSVSVCELIQITVFYSCDCNEACWITL